MAFLDTMLRDEGGFAYKKVRRRKWNLWLSANRCFLKAIVDAIITIIHQQPETKEKGLSYLCEFIEDCDFAYLSSQILHLLGVEGPKVERKRKQRTTNLVFFAGSKSRQVHSIHLQ